MNCGVDAPVSGKRGADHGKMELPSRFPETYPHKSSKSPKLRTSAKVSPKKPRVVVAMSGGVDSSVAAALLTHQGYEVIGMMMRLWSEPGSEVDNRCCTPEAMAMARRVSAQLGIQFYTVDAQDEFYSQVVEYFIDGYAQGITPNPCIACNRHVRWNFLLNRALSLGADFFATGHYARLNYNDDGRIQLLEAVDRDKDQSYVLHGLGQEQLAHTLFPLGIYTKTQVREMAREFDLPVAERSDSQDLCFLAGNDYRPFLLRHAPLVNYPGPIMNMDGQSIGKHHGLAFYTIGQRKGLGISAREPLYVVAINREKNSVIVGSKNEVYGTELTAAELNWISVETLEQPMRVKARIRYLHQEADAVITPLVGNRVQVKFAEPQMAITPGQAVVFYDGDEVVGGGVIK